MAKAKTDNEAKPSKTLAQQLDRIGALLGSEPRLRAGALDDVPPAVRWMAKVDWPREQPFLSERFGLRRLHFFRPWLIHEAMVFAATPDQLLYVSFRFGVKADPRVNSIQLRTGAAGTTRATLGMLLKTLEPDAAFPNATETIADDADGWVECLKMAFLDDVGVDVFPGTIGGEAQRFEQAWPSSGPTVVALAAQQREGLAAFQRGEDFWPAPAAGESATDRIALATATPRAILDALGRLGATVEEPPSSPELPTGTLATLAGARWPKGRTYKTHGGPSFARVWMFEPTALRPFPDQSELLADSKPYGYLGMADGGNYIVVTDLASRDADPLVHRLDTHEHHRSKPPPGLHLSMFLQSLRPEERG